MPSTAERLAAARQTLEQAGQGHVLAHADALDEPAKLRLLEQVEQVDWPEVARLVRSHVLNRPAVALPERIEPAPAFPATPADEPTRARYHEARKHGEELLRRGKVAAFIVAGGQGTRLGWDAPKGTFPASPVRKASLFQLFAEYLLKVRHKFGRPVPLYVMTSDVNHAATEAFFKDHEFFGLDPAGVMLFPQAMMPAFDMATGKALLAAPDSLALSPNGHGGSLKALWTSGALDDMKRRGVEQISYFQVDNPLVKCVDPLFIGLHALEHAEMSSKSLPKRDWSEKVGNFAIADGKMTVIEYSNLPDEIAQRTNPDGSLVLNAGSIAIHVIATSFVEKLNTAPGGFALPWNRAEKKVPYVEVATGKEVKPDTPNAVKLETFVFDALPLAEKSIVLETVRDEEFGPIKNASGPDVQDSPETSAQLQSERSARWLRHAGVGVASGATVELTHLTAIEPTDLAAVRLPASIPADAPTVL